MESQHKDELERQIKSLIQVAENLALDAMHEARSAFEKSTQEVLKNLGTSFKGQLERLETRPLVPGIALLVTGFILGGLAFRGAKKGAARPSPLRTGTGLEPVSKLHS